MKRLLGFLAFSILLFGLIVSYDITKCDGQVIVKHLIRSSYEPVLEEGYEYVPADKNIKTTDESDFFGESVVEIKETVLDTEADLQSDADEGHDEEDAARGYEYYFSFLNESEKDVYRAMYTAFSNIESGNSIPTVDEDSMNRVANFIRLDHPEFFYARDLGYTHYTMGGQIVKTVLAVTYSDSKAAIRSQLEYADRVADEVIAQIPAGADDYTKAKIIYEWVIRNTDYNTGASDNQNMLSVFYGRQSVCAGYSRAYQYIMNKAGVDTTVVEGATMITGENHAWNLCKLEDGYYYVDTTWGDASYKKNGFSGENVASLNYDYLLVTTEEIKRTHEILLEDKMPLCTSTANNYYVREGLYFMTYDHEEVKRVFDRAYELGEETVSIKCANLEVYDMFRRELISGNGVFDMLKDNSSTISYIEDEEQRTLCFWL